MSVFGCVHPLANASLFFLFFCVRSVIAALIKAKRMFPQRNDALSL